MASRSPSKNACAGFTPRRRSSKPAPVGGGGRRPRRRAETASRAPASAAASATRRAERLAQLSSGVVPGAQQPAHRAGIGSPPSYQPGRAPDLEVQVAARGVPGAPDRPIAPPVTTRVPSRSGEPPEQVRVHGVDRGRPGRRSRRSCPPRLVEADLAGSGRRARRASASRSGEQVLALVPAPGAEAVAVGVAGGEREAVVGRRRSPRARCRGDAPPLPSSAAGGAPPGRVRRSRRRARSRRAPDAAEAIPGARRKPCGGARPRSASRARLMRFVRRYASAGNFDAPAPAFPQSTARS